MSNLNKKSLKDNVNRDLDIILREMNKAGFWTQKGSNTYLLANIMADFVNRAIDNRKYDIGVLSLWDSQELAVVAPLMYARYRIYNLRHHPKVWDVSDIGQDLSNLKLGDSISGYQNLVYTLNNTASNMDIVRRSIGRLDNTEPVSLGIDYNMLLTRSRLTLNDFEFYESTMSETGVYIENDYIILPDENNIAIFYPITNFKAKTGIQKGSLTLTLFTKPKVKANIITLPVISDSFDSDPDFLRFLLTQLMSKFPIYRGYSVQDLIDFISIKYNKQVFLLDESEKSDGSDGSEGSEGLDVKLFTFDSISQQDQQDQQDHKPEIVVDLASNQVEELRRFAEINMFEDVDINKPKLTTVIIKISDYSLSQKIERFISKSDFNNKKLYKYKDVMKDVHEIINMYFIENYGIEASYVKSRYDIEVTLEDFNFSGVEGFEYFDGKKHLESNNITKLYFTFDYVYTE